MRVIHYIDVPIVVVAAIVAAALGAPLFGAIMGAGVWILQRVVAEIDARVLRARVREPKDILTANLFERFARIWLLAGGIIVAGVAGVRADGLTAALLIFGAYSIQFSIRVLSGPPTTQGRKAG